MATSSKPALLDWGMLILLGVIWGAAFLGTKIALDDLGPLWVAAFRIALASLILVPIAIFGPGLPDLTGPSGRRTWLHCLGMAIFTNALPFALLSWAQLHVTSAFAGISMAAVPLLVLPLAHFMVPGEQMTLRMALGFLVGFAGTVVLIGLGTFEDIGMGGVVAIAQVTCVMAAFCYAIGSIITRLCPPVPQLSFSAGALMLAAVISCVIAFGTEGVPHWPSMQSVGGIFYLGIFCTGLATVLLVTLIRRAGPGFLSQVNYQVPVWAIVFGALVLGETIPTRFPLALGLILAGLAIVQLARRRAATSAVSSG